MKKYIALLLALFVTLQVFTVCADGENSEETAVTAVNIVSSSDDFGYSLYKAGFSTETERNGKEISVSDVETEITFETAAVFEFECGESGLYALKFDYAVLEKSNSGNELDILIDGEFPFSEAKHTDLPYFYTMGEITVNSNGDDVRPNTEIDSEYHNYCFYNKSSVSAVPYEFYIEKGQHTLTLNISGGKISVKNLMLYSYSPAPSYEEYISGYSVCYTGEALPVVEAENFLYTNSSYVIASSEPGDCETTPSDPYIKKINTVGGSNWKNVGDTVAWKIDAPESGLYEISFRYKQSFQSGLNSYRILYVNGEIPFEEAALLAFPYSNDWKISDFGYSIYLNKGENIIALEATLGEMAPVLDELNETVSELNSLYRNIIMITGTSPDSYRDYNLQDEIPDIAGKLKSAAEKIDSVYKKAKQYIDGSGQLYVLSDTCRQLEDMAKDLRSITKGSRLSRFKSNISSVSSLSANLSKHPLMLDSFSIHGASGSAFKKSSIGERLVYRFKRFISTFSDDYSAGETENEINVWISSGRDQLQVLNDMIENDFTPQTGISVNLQLVTGSLIHAILAGKGPDAALGHGETDVINYAMRGAVEDLSKYSDYEKTTAQFSENAMLPYTYNGGVYALPETQGFNMMFVRTDILDELNIDIPDTWDGLIKNVLPALNRNNLTVGLDNLSTGGSLQSLYTTVLTQAGGSLYTDDLLSSDLGSQTALDCFDFVVSLYRDYGIPQEYDFVNRFRTGEMPIGLSSYTTFNQLQISAPEINGLWEMCEIPGTVEADGSINRSQIMSSTAAVMLSSSDNKEQTWEFLKWFTGAEAQLNFGLQIEAVLGEAGRYATANTEAIKGLSWQKAQLDALESQRSKSTALQQVPGSYYVGKALNSATVLSVTKDEKIAREELAKWDELIDAEISRKSEEFNYKGKQDEQK